MLRIFDHRKTGKSRRILGVCTKVKWQRMGCIRPEEVSNCELYHSWSDFDGGGSFGCKGQAKNSTEQSE